MRSTSAWKGWSGVARSGGASSVLDVIERFKAAFVCDYILLGGGNAKLMRDLPPHVILGANENAILGGIEVWNPDAPATDAITNTHGYRIKGALDGK